MFNNFYSMTTTIILILFFAPSAFAYFIIKVNFIVSLPIVLFFILSLFVIIFLYAKIIPKTLLKEEIAPLKQKSVFQSINEFSKEYEEKLNKRRLLKKDSKQNKAHNGMLSINNPDQTEGSLSIMNKKDGGVSIN